MSTLHLVKPSFTECVICKKPLGQESRDLEMRLCHEHRKCSKCEQDLRPAEQKWAHEKALESSDSIEVIHPRCAVLTHPTPEQDPTLSIKQSEYDYLNLIRLMIEPDQDLSVITNENNAMIRVQQWMTGLSSFDDKSVALKKLEACVAQASIIVRTDPKYRKDALKERDAKREKTAKQEALTSSRPANKPADDDAEVRLGSFMQEHDLKDRKVAQTIMRDYDKAVLGFTKTGIPMSMALTLVTQAMVKSGRLTK